MTTLCLNRDARQFGIAWPPAHFIGADVLILAPEHGDRVAAELGSAFDGIETLPDASIRHAGRTLRTVAVFQARRLRVWPPPARDGISTCPYISSMSMVSDRVLSPTELRALSGRSNAAGARRLAIHVALLAGTGWLVAISGPVTLVPAMLAFGLVQVALFAPAHEATHQTAFASRRANLIVGWLAACPSLLNLHFYTAFHFAHHRHTQIPGQDPELDMESPDTLGAYVRRILGVPYWRLRLLVIADCWRGDLSRYPYVSEQAAPAIIRSVRGDERGDGRRVGGVGAAVRLGDAVRLLDLAAAPLPAVPARVCAGGAHRLHAGPQRADQHAHHADQRAPVCSASTYARRNGWQRSWGSIRSTNGISIRTAAPTLPTRRSRSSRLRTSPERPVPTHTDSGSDPRASNRRSRACAAASRARRVSV